MCLHVVADLVGYRNEDIPPEDAMPKRKKNLQDKIFYTEDEGNYPMKGNYYNI